MLLEYTVTKCVRHSEVSQQAAHFCLRSSALVLLRPADVGATARLNIVLGIRPAPQGQHSETVWQQVAMLALMPTFA
jgi:hypothetical protein